MTTGNQDNFADFLKTIPGLDLEEAVQEPSPPVSIRVVLARLPGFGYAVHCLVKDTDVKETDLEGELIRGQWTFPAGSLAQFSETYENLLKGCGIEYDRNPPVPPGPGQNVVSYKLVKPMADPRGIKLLEKLVQATKTLYDKLD